MAVKPVIHVGVDRSWRDTGALEWALQESLLRQEPLEVVHVWIEPLVPVASWYDAELAEYGPSEAFAASLIDRELDAIGADLPDTIDIKRAPVYGSVARTLVHSLKYQDRTDLAPAMGRWMARAGRELLADADILVPVPLHWRRAWHRRYNQSGALARVIERQSGVKMLWGGGRRGLWHSRRSVQRHQWSAPCRNLLMRAGPSPPSSRIARSSPQSRWLNRNGW